MLLRDNPFYILDVSLSANRRKIAGATDEMSFVLGSDKCSEAQSILTNPAKRLQSELEWFPETSSEVIAEIRECISNNQQIRTDNLSGCSKLNAMLHNLELSKYLNIFEFGFDLVAIDEQYRSIDIRKITSVINEKREKAGMSAVSENDVQEGFKAKNIEIRKLVNEKLNPYGDKSYVEFVTIVAEKYIADKRYNAGPVLSDVVDQYEIKIQSTLEEKTNQVKRYIKTIKSEQSEDIIRKSIPKLIELVREWDIYAQPLQLRSQVSGLPHETSQDLASELRNLCLYLNNEKNMPSEAKQIASEMQHVFMELGELKEIFKGDTEKLSEIENSQKDSEKKLHEIEAELKEIKEAHYSSLVVGSKADDFIFKVLSLDQEIREAQFGTKTEEQLRMALCFIAREKAIDANNKNNDPSTALKIIQCLLKIFDDSESLKTTLILDESRLTMNSIGALSSGITKKKSNKAGVIIAVILVLVIVIAGIANSTKKNTTSSKSTSSSYSSSSSSSGKSTDKQTTKPTSKPVTISEKKYSPYTSAVGDKVYAEIVSIFPSQGIYTEKSISYSSFVCECKTSDGNTIWVNVGAKDYKTYIDSTIDTIVSKLSDTYTAKKISYLPAAKIHGKVISSNTIISGLNNDINTNKVIDFESIDIPHQTISQNTKGQVDALNTPIIGTTLDKNNFSTYFSSDIKTKDRSVESLQLTYDITPVTSLYAKNNASSERIKIKLRINLMKTKNGSVLSSKDFELYLDKSKGYKTSGTLTIPLSMDVKNIKLYWKSEILSCEGMIGK